MRLVPKLSFAFAVLFAQQVAISADATPSAALPSNVPTPLYNYQGKAFTTNDLAPDLQQTLYEVERQRYDNYRRIIDSAVLDNHFAQEAQKTKKTVDEVKASILKVTPATEANAKKWFEENKARLGGRDFSSIKDEVISYLTSQEEDKAKATLLEKLKKDGKFTSTVTEPVAPQISISSEGFPTKGNEKAKVTIVEFADYKCPHCKDAAENLRKVVDKFKDKVRFVFMDFPIDRSGVSKVVAEGAVCAQEQNKFWEYHYMAFGAQTNLSTDSAVKFATDLKLNVDAFKKCLAAPTTKQKVDNARKEGERIGVNGTPTIYINGRKFIGMHSDEALTAALKAYL